MTVRPAADQGFVLPSVLALIVIISLFLAATLSITLQAQRSSMSLARTTQEYYAAEAGVAEAINELAKSIEASTPFRSSFAFLFEGYDLEVLIEPEAMRLDVNRAPLEALQSELVELGFASRDAIEGAIQIQKARDKQSDGGVRPILGGSDKQMQWCLGAKLSEFDGRTGPTLQYSLKASYGEPYRIRAIVNADRPRKDDDTVSAVTAIVRLSGDPENPLLIQHWKRDQEPKQLPQPPCAGARP